LCLFSFNFQKKDFLQSVGNGNFLMIEGNDLKRIDSFSYAFNRKESYGNKIFELQASLREKQKKIKE